MNLEAEIARVQLSSHPPTIASRLLRRRDIAALIESGSAEVGEVGQFMFSDVRNTLASAPLDTFTALPGRPSTVISLARSADGMCRVRSASGAETTLPELSLLDPSAAVRLEGIERLAERAAPLWPRHRYWQSVICNGPLADNEFGMVLDELQGVAEHVLSEVVPLIERGRFNALEVVPTDRTYYESLLGQMPSETAAPKHVQEVLAPHLLAVFRKSASWGLRCVQAACISETVDPIAAAEGVSNDDLLSAIQTVGIGATPSALVATHKLALSRALLDQRFTPFAQEALEALYRGTCVADSHPGLDAWLPAWIRMTLGIIGQAGDLAAAPPYWRRIAAFAHATTLLSFVGFSEVTAKDIADWCAKRLTQESEAVEVLDHLSEPGWRAAVLTAGNLWASALLRVAQPAGDGTLAVPGLSVEQVEQASPQLALVAGTPDPLSGTRRDLLAPGVETRGRDLLDSLDAAVAGGAEFTPIQIWTGLAHHAQIYAFTDGLLERIRHLAIDLKPAAGANFAAAYESLAQCANVAAMQGDKELADLAVAVVLESAERFTKETDAVLSAWVVVLAAGTAQDLPSRMEWAGEKLLMLAYRMPKGKCCAALARTIATFQRQIPLSKRRWGKAFAVASSAAA